MAGMNVKIKEYYHKLGKRISVVKNTCFSERFGSTVVNPLRCENRKLWKLVLGEINKKRAKFDARGIDKKTFIGDYNNDFEKRSTEEERSPTCLARVEFFFGVFRLVFGDVYQARATQPAITTSGHL